MQAILFCDKITDCIPVQDCPEALLPFCNIPMLEYLLRDIEQKGFRNAVLLAADECVRDFIDTLSLQMPVRYARSLACLHADIATLLLRRLCIPDWDIGELYTICNENHPNAVRLFHADGTPTFAELHPQGSVLLEPKETAVTEISKFQHVRTPAEYRELQQKLLSQKKCKRSRIGEGVKTGQNTKIDDMTIIGNDCIIGDNVRLERCCLGDGVQIGTGTSLTDCVICRKSLIDKNQQLDNMVVPQGTVLYSDIRIAQAKRNLVLPDDGICEGLPRWNTAETALKAGAAATVLSNRLMIGYHHENGESLTLAAAAGAVSQGASVWLAGQCALSQMIAIANITDCHMLLWVQGEEVMQLQPFIAGGFCLTDRQNYRLWQALEAGVCDRITLSGRLHHAENLIPLWAEACEKLLSEAETNFDITVSCANAQLRNTVQKFFPCRNGQRLTLSLSEDGTKISIFTSDSGMLRHEQLLLLSLLSFAQQDEALVLPEDFHPSAEEFAARFDAKIIRLTPHDFASPAANLYRKQGVCKDGIKLLAHILKVLHQRKCTLKEAAQLLPNLCTVQHELPTTLTRQHVERLKHANPDTKINIIMPSHSRLVSLRAHADSIEAAAELCGFWEKKLRAAESE